MENIANAGDRQHINAAGPGQRESAKDVFRLNALRPALKKPIHGVGGSAESRGESAAAPVMRHARSRRFQRRANNANVIRPCNCGWNARQALDFRSFASAATTCSG